MDRPSDVFARRVKEARQRRGWNQAELTRRLREEGGWPVADSLVTKMETGARGVSLDEAVTVAWVLGVPPAFLYLPVGDAEGVQLTERVAVHPDRARQWAVGEAPTPTERTNRLVPQWSDDMAVWRLFDQFNEAVAAVIDAESAVSHAEYVGDPDEIKERRGDVVRALVSMDEASKAIRDRGMVAPAVSERILEAMKRAGMRYDGPVYPGPGGDEE